MKNISDEEPDELSGLCELLPAEILMKLNELLELMHRPANERQDASRNGNVIEINIYKSGSQRVDCIQNQYVNGTDQPLPGKRGEPRADYSDAQIAQAIAAICGDGKPLDSKQKWAGVHWLLRWECNYPARAKEFCERIAKLPLPEDLAYKCDYRNIRELSTLSFMNADPRELEKVKYSKHDESIFFQLCEVVKALERELRVNSSSQSEASQAPSG